jgi:fluoride exporter
MLYLLVFVGGGLGSLARYVAGEGVGRLCGTAFPYGTLAVNVLGSFLIGCAAVWALGELPGRSVWSSEMRALLFTGFFGGFTTFSTFSLQTLQLYQKGQPTAAFLNAGLSLSLCLLAVALGAFAGMRLAGR